MSMGLVKWVIATSATELQVGARLRTLLVRRAWGAANSENNSEKTAVPAIGSQLFATFPEEMTR